jgi:hypothetical protein
VGYGQTRQRLDKSPEEIDDADNRETATTKVQYQQDMKTDSIWIVIVNYLLDVCRCLMLGFLGDKRLWLGEQLVFLDIARQDETVTAKIMDHLQIVVACYT